MEYLKRSRKKKKKRLSFKNYKIIKDFSVVTEKDCIEADKYNHKIYRNALTDIDNAIRLIESNGLSANISVPRPPMPNNHKKFLLWMKRSVFKPAILQSQATLYLYNKGFIINKDYEAYQAIELANEHRIQEDLDPFDEQYLITQKNNFSNVYSNIEQNILRRRSLLHNSLDDLNINNSYDNFKQDNMTHQQMEQNNIHQISQSYPPSSINYPSTHTYPLNPVPTAPSSSYNIYPVLPTAPPDYNLHLVNRNTQPNTSINLNTNTTNTTNTNVSNTENNITTFNTQPDLSYKYHNSHNSHNSHISQNDDVHSVSNLVLNPHVIDRVNKINENEFDLL